VATEQGLFEPPKPVTSDGLYVGAAPLVTNTSSALTIAEVGRGFKNTQYCTGGGEKELL